MASHSLMFVATTFLIMSCNSDDQSPPVYDQPKNITGLSADIATQWADMTLYTIRYSAFNSPTYSSRSLGYMGLAMYESVVHGDSSYHSMDGQLEGLSIPAPDEGLKYDWVLSLNAAQDTLLKLLYPYPANSHRFIHERITALHKDIYEHERFNLDPVLADRSIAYGQSVALAIYNWSLSDGGDKGYSRNFDADFQFPIGDSYWVPPTRGQTLSPYPLHPYWGENRPFVKANNNIPIPDIVAFSTDTASEYYKLYKAVYDKDKTLTLEEREIAAWWGDDPTESFSPPGHSYYMASQAIIRATPNLPKAAETYARVGMAVADAFIHCWKAKYTYFNERPSSYVKKYIDDKWVQFWPEPPFPAFPSGHAMNSSAASTVLSDLYGESLNFYDRSHVGYRRTDDLRFLDLTYNERYFANFSAAAFECAQSRFYGGIHTQQDNRAGMTNGAKVGANVNALKWRD